MRAILVAIGVLFAATSAAAVECRSGSPTVLSVEDWSITLVDKPPIKGMDIAIKLKNNGTKAMRMVDGSYRFEDALGRHISSFALDPDLKIKPGEIVETATGYMGQEMDRVPEMNRDDVKVVACTRAVVYEDGTKEEFK